MKDRPKWYPPSSKTFNRTFCAGRVCSSKTISTDQLLVEKEKIGAIEDELNVRIEIKEDVEVVVTGNRCEEAKNAIEEKLL